MTFMIFAIGLHSTFFRTFLHVAYLYEIILEWGIRVLFYNPDINSDSLFFLVNDEH